MGFSITTDHAHRLVRIEHWDELSREEMFKARAQAGSLLKENGFSHLLVDVRQIDEPPDTMDTFSMATSHDTALPPGFRLAVLVPYELVADALFSENVSVNRGFSYKVFIDEEDALAWLRQTGADT